MKILIRLFHFNYLTVILSLFSTKAIGHTHIKVMGYLKGQLVGKVYLFFENDYANKYKRSANIVNGCFHFNCDVSLPILARLHLSGNSYIRDFYIDSHKTILFCSNRYRIYPSNDTLNLLSIDTVIGSNLEKKRFMYEKEFEQISIIGNNDSLKKYWFYKLSNFISQNSQSKLSPYLIAQSATLMSYSELLSLLNLLNSSLAETSETKDLIKIIDKTRPELLARKRVGEKFLNISLPDTSLSKKTLDAILGKCFLIVFWASWCVPCREQHYELKKLYDRYHYRGLEIINISFDSQIYKWKNAIRDDHLEFIQLIDSLGFKGELATFYNIEGIPSVFLLDQNKKMLSSINSISDAEKLIEPTLTANDIQSKFIVY